MAEHRQAGDAVGRPGPKKKPLDLDLIKELARFGNTEHDIAIICGFNPSYFSEMKKTDPRIQETIDNGYSEMKSSLRRKQLEVAMEGDRTLLVFLGKAILNQSDRMDINAQIDHTIDWKIDFGEEAAESARKRKAEIDEESNTSESS